jgi:hypothetical protein
MMRRMNRIDRIVPFSIAGHYFADGGASKANK